MLLSQKRQEETTLSTKAGTANESHWELATRAKGETNGVNKVQEKARDRKGAQGEGEGGSSAFVISTVIDFVN